MKIILRTFIFLRENLKPSNMKFSKLTVFAAALAMLVAPLNSIAQKWDNLALTPPMGWSSWNKFGQNISEKDIMEIADALVSSGLADCGYVYVNIDDCWHGERDAKGYIQCDSVTFPSGIKALADYVHSKGLKLGIYSDAGCRTCAGEPGSLGHEYQDAMTYAEWGVDYLKYDWCNAPDQNAIGSYRLMRDALYASGRPILFSVCEWGINRPWEWAPEIGHIWRTTGDIGCVFDQDKYYGENYWTALGVLQIVDKNEPLRKYAGPGHWNDPDMLEVGNGMSENEDRVHFTLWCMMAAPLILGNDVRDMSDATKAILTNKEVIAVDQDALGVQGWRFITRDGVEYWYKPLVDGDWALCVFNRNRKPVKVELDWADLATHDVISNNSFNPHKDLYKIRNLWKHKDEGTTAKNVTVDIPARDVVLYRFSPASK